jgi:hypothetical protein
MDRDPTLAELSRLRWVATALVGWLVLVTAGGGLAAMALLYAPYDLDSSAYQIVLCATGGAFGAGLASLLSVVTLISRGWELGDGSRRPLRGDGQRFAGRLAPMYMVRPLFGAAVGLIAYFVLMGLLLLVLTGGSDMSFEPMGLLSVSLATGFFAQTLLERTRQMLEAFFERSPMASAATGVATATTSAPVAAAAVPTKAPVPAPAAQAPAPPSAVQQPQQFGLQGGAAGDERG